MGKAIKRKKEVESAKQNFIGFVGKTEEERKNKKFEWKK